ncbi:hypothetical protein BH11GEM2_BH11GEM2_39710 [soil metagenome]|jgi:hypothetical protein
MRILWTLLKVIVGLAIAIPLGIVALGLTIGVVGVVLGLAILALKLAFVGFVGYGLYRLARYFLAPTPAPIRSVGALPMPDPYYEAAMRELDREVGRSSGR